MALCYAIGIIIQVMEIVGQSNTYNPTTEETSSSANSHDGSVFHKLGEYVTGHYSQILCVAAGFMTASLIFSIGCFVTKYKTSSRKNKTAVTGDQLLAVPPAHEYANEGSFESDVKSYAYVDIDKKNDKDKFSTSVKSTKYNRESYDFVERNRIASSEEIDNVNDNTNPYNHVATDMDDNVYNNSSFYKNIQQSMKDPTYSHLSDLTSKTQGQHNKAYESHSTPSTSTEERNTAHKNGNQNTKQSMISNKQTKEGKVSDTNTTSQERDKVGNTMKEKEVMNGNISNTHNIIEEEGKVRNPYNMNIEKDKVITANTKITEGYDTSTSSVMKEEDKVNETSTTVVEVKVIGENDDSAKQLATNDITIETEGHSMLDHSRNGQKEEKKLKQNKHDYSLVITNPNKTAISQHDGEEKALILEDKDNSDDGRESSNEELTLIELNEEETHHLLESDEASVQSGSDVDGGNGSTMQITAMATNCLYEAFYLKEGECQGSDEGSQEHVELQITSCINANSVVNMS